jgi:hybrid cluster-associated redox disulfide protein
MNLDTKMTIDNLLLRHPQAAAVFIRRMMFCVGCPAAKFHTLIDASKLYGYKLEDISGEIILAVNAYAGLSGSGQIPAVRDEQQGAVNG